ncbi:hypothetical protein FF100_36525 [Methylobacterium terricola]|uniref:Uncharacterized protein n=1 Tax=Methylobacterium terricola TaxID=2583531 RepID=A0A5C4L5F4_9HYPH|nr:BrnT family toxin [Methylobacterium terricola]TNC04554.1 hypothetical protein FF100_36525 [Methylobacterium terricola]
MLFTYDEPKRQANLLKHGFDFDEFEAAFDFDRYAVMPTKPSRTGRPRRMLVGTWYGVTVVVVIVSPLGTEATSLISIRRADRTERAAYDAL